MDIETRLTTDGLSATRKVRDDALEQARKTRDAAIASAKRVYKEVMLASFEECFDISTPARRPYSKASEEMWGRLFYTERKTRSKRITAAQTAYKAVASSVQGTGCSGSMIRRAREYESEGWRTDNALEDIYAKQNGRCPYCGNESPLTEDHIVPLSKGGTCWITNLVGACRSCNSSKGARSVEDFAGVTPSELLQGLGRASIS